MKVQDKLHLLALLESELAQIEEKAWEHDHIIPRLGIHNMAYVAWYRFSTRFGIRKRFFPQRDLGESGKFFDPVESKTEYPEKWKSDLLRDAGKICRRIFKLSQPNSDK